MGCVYAEVFLQKCMGYNLFIQIEEGIKILSIEKRSKVEPILH